MASHRPIMARPGQVRALFRPRTAQISQICLLCTASATPIRPRHKVHQRSPPQLNHTTRRYSSTVETVPLPNPRVELEQTLLELQKQCPNSINLSRLQLALQGLKQGAGEEVVRIAILGLSNGGKEHVQTARRLIRALLADPLSDEQSWEAELSKYDPKKPLIIRVGPVDSHGATLEFARHNPIEEIHISSADYNGLNLEFLVMEASAPYGAAGAVPVSSLEEAVLVPTVDIASAEDRISPMATPVHHTLLVGEGMTGAVNISALPITEAGQLIEGVVNMAGVSKEQLNSNFNIIDISQAEDAVHIFRQGPQNAIQYERLWFASNLPTISTWLKQNTKAASGETKPAIKNLLESLLRNTQTSINDQEAALTALPTLTPLAAASVSASLQTGVNAWSKLAHAELQEGMDRAFAGRRWRKLGWWKLFWRVDDVGMLTNDILAQRFLPTSERELIYLTGRIAEQHGATPRYPQPVSSSDTVATPSTASALPKWPGHIAFTRGYLQNETIPALQSLAQRLVMQSVGGSTVATSLAGLLYVSSFSSTLYEVGAIAALGIVYSLGRMQKKWEAARTYWEGETREEGRKAIRGAEESIATALSTDTSAVSGAAKAEISLARELATKAEEALSRMK